MKQRKSPQTKSIASGKDRDKSGAIDIRRRLPTLLICLFLIAATIGVYWQVGNHEFVAFDDDLYVTENLHVHEGLTSRSVKWAFSASDISYWHPVTWLSLMLDYELYGLSSRGYHFTNLLFHIFNALLLFLVLQRLTGSLWQSGFVAALFALHPLNVESVAWVVERKNVLSTFFWMLTIWGYGRYAESPKLSRYILVFLTLALGLMAKPVLVTLPLVMLLLDYWPLGRLRLQHSEDANKQETMTWGHRKTPFLRLILEKVPFLALCGTAIYIASSSVQLYGKVIPTTEVPIKLRLANGLVSYVKYIGKMVWPQKLAFFYPYPSSVPIWQAVGAGLFLGFLTLLVLRVVRRHPYLIVGWLWYLGTLGPAIGLKQVGLWPAMADRFAYVPLIGLFIIIAWGIPELIGGWQHRRAFLAISSTAVLIGLMVCTWQQVSHWANSTALFENALDVTVGNYVAHNNLGIELDKEGKTKEAVYHYSEALRLRPTYDDAHNNLGHILQRQGRLAEADVHLRTALRLNPKMAEAHNNLGIVLERQGRLEEAISHYTEALRLKHDHVKVHNNLGIALARQGRLEEAISRFSEALRINPNLAETHNNLGIALARQGRLEEAISHFSEAVRLKPDYTQARDNLNLVLQRAGKRTKTPNSVSSP